MVIRPASGVAAPTVQVAALMRDRSTGGIYSEFIAQQAGTSNIGATTKVESALQGAELDVAGLRMFALDASSYTANARQAQNFGTGDTAVRLSDATVRATGVLSLVAQDRSAWKATGGGYSGSAEENWYGQSAIPDSLAGNQVSASVTVDVGNASLRAADVRAWALATQTLDAEIKLGKVGPIKDSFLGFLLPFDIDLGALRAWNALNGSTTVDLDRSSVLSTQGISLAARDAARLSARTPAGSVAPEGGDQEPVLAINLVGWRDANVATIALSRLGGGEPADTLAGRETTVTVQGSRLEAGGALAADARSSLVLRAIAGALADTGSGEVRGLAVAAAGLAAVNRSRTDTRTRIDSQTGVATLKAGGTISVLARDAATVQAHAGTWGVGSAGSVQAGGLLVLNDLRRDVSAEIDGLGLDAGALAIEALDSATIEAKAAGQVSAYGTNPFDDWTDLADNGSVATNWLLGGVSVAANDADIRLSGDASLRADAAATLEASNKVLTRASGAGTALAFNVIGRQSAGTLKAGGVREFLSGSSGTVATYEVGASFDKGFVDIGGDLAIHGNLALKATATLEQGTRGAFGASSAALAQNLSEASTVVRFAPDTGVDHYVGGDLRLGAKDAAVLNATGSMSATGFFARGFSAPSRTGSATAANISTSSTAGPSATAAAWK